MCLAPHLTRCHRSKNYSNGYRWCQPLSTLGTGSLNHFACPSASYHAIPYLCITDDNCFILELFHTKSPSVKASNNCGFCYTFHKFYFLYSQPFESTWSFQLSMRPTFSISFQWSISGLNFCQITRIHELCQGKFFTCALIKLPTAEAYRTISHWFL